MPSEKNRQTTSNSRVRIHVSPAKRHLWMLIGHLSLGLGIIGLLLPLVPTSPFVIAAAYCYARSSEKFYYMLLNNRYFGKHIQHWEDNRCLQKRLKILISIMLTLMFLTSIIFFVPSIEMRIFAVSLAVIALLTVWMIPLCDKG